MVEYFKLDKIIKQGVTYQAPSDEFLVIRKVGTDTSSDVYLKIDGVDTGPFIDEIAPLHKTDSNLLGPLDLKQLYYVVPPNKKFWIEGPSGARVRIIGQIGKLAVGETMPAEFAGRFKEQGKKYITYVTGSYSLGTDAVWPADSEYEVFSLTPKTTELYKLNGYVGVTVSGGDFAEGDFAIRFYLEGKPLDNLTKDIAPLGIDVLSMPRPPADTTEMEPFTLADRPIEVKGDQTLTVKAVNVSGSDKTPTSGSAWTINFIAMVEYEKTGR